RLVALDVRPPKPSRTRLDARAEREAARLERLAETHPCHACPERATHERWAVRASRLEQQIRGVERRIRTRTETLARQFERVLGVLEDLGYVRGFAIQPKGLVSTFVYEARERVPRQGEMPTAESAERYRRLIDLYRRIRRSEDAHQV